MNIIVMYLHIAIPFCELSTYATFEAYLFVSPSDESALATIIGSTINVPIRSSLDNFNYSRAVRFSKSISLQNLLFNRLFITLKRFIKDFPA